MKEFMTFKSGKFYFCDIYDKTVTDPLFYRAVVLLETINDLPVLPQLASNLDPEIMYSSISATAKIEGSPIGEEDVRRLADGEDLPQYTQKDKQEVFNLIELYQWLAELKVQKEDAELTEEIIKKAHSIVTKDIPDEDNMPGRYRSGKVYVGDKAHGGAYTPPKILEDVKNLMGEFVSWINCPGIKELHPFIRASLAHYHFSLIHPFWDGNGRTARFIESLILQSAGVKYIPRELSNFYYRNVDDYYIAFSKSQRNKKDVTPFVQFMLEGAVESLEQIKTDITLSLRLFTLRTYYESAKAQKALSNRQFELMSLLLDQPEQHQFTLKDLLSVMPFRLLYREVTDQTARRDIQRLLTLGLITEDNKKYLLNIYACG